MKIKFSKISTEDIVSSDTSLLDELIDILKEISESYDAFNDSDRPDIEDDFVEYLIEHEVSSYDVALAISKHFNIENYTYSGSDDLIVMSKEAAIVYDNVAYFVNPFSRDDVKSLSEKKTTGYVSYDSVGVVSREQFEYQKEKNSDLLLDEIIQMSKTEKSQEEAKNAFTNIILDAIKKNASDIHINPGMGDAEIYFRISGSLEKQYYDNIKIDNGIYMALVYIIHYEAGKDYLETIPQSAKFVFSLGFRNIYLRMEVVPTKVGIDVLPKLTLRILGLDANFADINKLGFTPSDISDFQNASNKENGIIIVTGPTGSGKSTTLYSLLNQVRKKFPEKSIFTVEDPVEMSVDKISQIEVNEKAGMTFETALRSILRLDPDVIMVGEIRDLETAQMAIRAALTGHLVLTTLHTNSAIGAVPRLLDLGVEKTLLADSLSALTAQRLVKKVCNSCSTPVMFSEIDEWNEFSELFDADEQLLKASVSGCMECNSGYSGRVILNEIIVINNKKIGKNIADDIMKNFAKGSLKDDAISKIRAWGTTIEAVESILRE